jgi:hypothetical protein
MRWRAAVVLVLVVGLAVAAGCTGDDDRADGDPAPTTAAPGGPIVAPEVFRHDGGRSTAGWSWVGATDDALVGLGGSPDGTSSYGQVVDLATGEVRDVERPPAVDGRSVEASAAAFLADRVVVAGFLPPVGGYPPGTDRAPDVEAVSFALDPADGSWTLLDGPDVALGMGRFARLDLDGRDGVLGTFTREYATGTERARLVGERWEPVATTPDRRASLPADPACTSAGELWEAVRDGDGSWARVEASSLEDGTDRVVAVPGLRSPAVDPAVLGCGGDAVVVAQMDGAERIALLLATTDGGETWTDLLPQLPEGRTILGAVVPGADHGLVVRAHLVEPGDDGSHGDEGTSDASLVVAPDGTARALDVEEVSTPVVWRGRTGELLALEPRPDGTVEVRPL